MTLKGRLIPGIFGPSPIHSKRPKMRYSNFFFTFSTPFEPQTGSTEIFSFQKEKKQKNQSLTNFWQSEDFRGGETKGKRFRGLADGRPGTAAAKGPGEAVTYPPGRRNPRMRRTRCRPCPGPGSACPPPRPSNPPRWPWRPAERRILIAEPVWF